MIYFILLIVALSIRDIIYLKSKKLKKDLYAYIGIMLLVGAFGIFYYLNPERESFSKILLSLIGKEG